jgi:hypothetical protein
MDLESVVWALTNALPQILVEAPSGNAEIDDEIATLRHQLEATRHHAAVVRGGARVGAHDATLRPPAQTIGLDELRGCGFRVRVSTEASVRL